MQSLKTVLELGPARSAAYLMYRALKIAGVYRFMRSPGRLRPEAQVSRLAVGGPGPGWRIDEAARERTRRLLEGEAVLFGGLRAPLDFSAAGPLRHWTAYDRGQVDGKDIKLTWEPGRFGWVGDLVRTHAAGEASGLAEFLAATWTGFIRANPPYRGPFWASAQEVAIRLIHLVFAESVLGPCIPDFAHVVAVHTGRFAGTLFYAYAQNNNHLLSEAAGLLTAGVVLAGHPRAERWRRSGWEIFNGAVRDQFEPDGAYIQQSTNYHRLALMLAVWSASVGRGAGLTFPPETLERLAAGTRWLLDLCDPATGRVPNLGANDGARILPLSAAGQADFRPELQAAAQAFLGRPAFAPGPWDETGAWLRAGEVGAGATAPSARGPGGMIRLDHPDLDSRLFLRAARFHGRPGHADQLHVDLWWRGENIALDPGTYSYNADPPWDNGLQSAHHHNTLTIDGRDQMTRAGRFLYIDRAQATVLDVRPGRAGAEHDGYRALGLVHRREVEAVPDGWRVTDRVEGAGGAHSIRLQWLLPDWRWRVEDTWIRLEAPAGSVLRSRPMGLDGPLGSGGPLGLAGPLESAEPLGSPGEPTIMLEIILPDGLPFELALSRAGEPLIGLSPLPTIGWYSPTYAVRQPALSFAITLQAEPPVLIESRWRLRENTP